MFKHRHGSISKNTVLMERLNDFIGETSFGSKGSKLQNIIDNTKIKGYYKGFVQSLSKELKTKVSFKSDQCLSPKISNNLIEKINSKKPGDHIKFSKQEDRKFTNFLFPTNPSNNNSFLGINKDNSSGALLLFNDDSFSSSLLNKNNQVNYLKSTANSPITINNNRKNVTSPRKKVIKSQLRPNKTPKNIIQNNKNKKEKFEKLYDNLINKISLKNYFEFIAGSHFNDN